MYKKFLFIFLVTSALFIPSYVFWDVFRVLNSDMSVQNGPPSGVASSEFHDYMIQIKKDLEKDHPELSKSSVELYVGPFYFSVGVTAIISQHSPGRYHIIVDEVFYGSLTGEEKRALIAHEMGHLDNIVDSFGRFDMSVFINSQMQADTFAVKYVDPDTLIGLLKKTQDFNPEYHMRISNLNKLKLKQGK